MKRKFDYGEGEDTTLQRKKKQKIETPKCSIFVTNIFVDSIYMNCVTVVGRNSKSERVVWKIYNCSTYVYVKPRSPHVGCETKIIENFIVRNKKIKRYIRRINVIEGFPLKGFEHAPSKFLVLHLHSENDRICLERERKNKARWAQNVLEGSVTLIERFRSDTGICEGKWVDVIGTEHPSTVPNMIKWNVPSKGKSLYYSKYMNCLHYFRDQNKACQKRPQIVPNLKTCSYRFIQETALRNRKYPVANVTGEYKRERMVTMNYSRDFTDPITAVVIDIRNSMDCLQEDNKTIVLTRKKLSKEAQGNLKELNGTRNDGVEIIYIRKHNERQAEIKLISEWLKILRNVDCIVGFKIKDSLNFNSFHYAIQRLGLHGVRGLNMDYYMVQHINNFAYASRVVDTKNRALYYDCVRNIPFKLPFVVDLYDYATNHLQGVKTNKPLPYNSSFTIMYNHFMKDSQKHYPHEDQSMFLNSSAKKFGTLLKQEVEKTCLLSDFVIKMNIVTESFERAISWNCDIKYIWTLGQSKIFRSKFLRKLSQLKHPTNLLLGHCADKVGGINSTNTMCKKGVCYVIAKSKNYSEKSPTNINLVFESGEGSRDGGGRGGRTIKPVCSFNNGTSCTIDFSNNYPGILVGANMDYTNVVFGKDKIRSLVAFGFSLFHIEVGRMLIGFVQNEKRQSPLVAMLNEEIYLRSKAKKMGNFVKSGVIKKGLVSVTGCLSITKYNYIFESFPIGETMRWIARKRFSDFVSLTNRCSVLLNSKMEASIKRTSVITEKEKSLSAAVMDLFVMAGHTDGFDFTLVDKENHVIECPINIMQTIALKICQFLNNVDERIGFMNISDMSKINWPKIGIEKIAEKTFYINTNKMAWVENKKLYTKGAAYINDVHNCILYENIMKEVLEKILKDEDYENEGLEFLRKFKKNVNERVRIVKEETEKDDQSVRRKFTIFKRVTDHDQKHKFAPLHSSHTQVLLNRFQKKPSFEIPSKNQFVGSMYVIEKDGSIELSIPPSYYNNRKYSIDIGKYTKKILSMLDEIIGCIGQ